MMEVGNGVGSEHGNGGLEKAPEVDGLGLKVNKENENVDNGVDALQVNGVPEDPSKVVSLNSSGAEDEVSMVTLESKGSKKPGLGRVDRLKNSKEQKGQVGRNGPATFSRNQRPGISQSLSFPSKGVLTRGMRKSTTDMKHSEVAPSGSNGGLPAKRSNLASMPSTCQSLALKSGSVDATANGTISEAPLLPDHNQKSSKHAQQTKNDDDANSSASSTTPRVSVQRKGNGFGFASRLDERAEKRKEFFLKLEEKTTAKEVEKTNLQEKSKENQEAEIKQLRKTLTFKATPMPSFYKEPGPPKVELKKVPTTRAISPKLGRRKPSAAVADNSSDGSASCRRSSRPSLEPNKLNGGAGNGNGGSIALKKPLQKSLSKMPSQKSAIAKVETETPGMKLKLSNPESDVVKAKLEINENQNKISEETPPGAEDCIELDSTESTAEEDKTILFLPDPEIINPDADETSVKG